MVLYIKYMVSLRCKMIVKTELTELGLQYAVIDAGSVEIHEGITQKKRQQLKENLYRSGFELLDDKEATLLEKIVTAINNMTHHASEMREKDYPDYLSKKTGLDYSVLSDIFTEVKCMTIQQFININKIERVKELLLYDELSIKEITLILNFKSVAYLTAEFKKVTGLSLSFFKQVKKKRTKVITNTP